MLQFQVETQHRLAIVTMSGVVTGADIAGTIPAIYSRSEWQPAFNILWEGSLITELLFERDDLSGLLKIQRSYADRARGGRDVIVTDRAIDQMMDDLKMYVSLVQHIRPTSLAGSIDEAMGILAHHNTARKLPRDGEPIT